MWLEFTLGKKMWRLTQGLNVWVAGIVLEYVLPPDRPDPKFATMKLKYRISLSRD